MKTDKGFSHIGLATHDLEGTRAFYEGILGFPVVMLDTVTVTEGGVIRHILFNVGRDQLLAFMEPKDVCGVPVDFDTSLNRSIGVPSSFYHIALEAGSIEGLKTRKKLLEDHGIKTTPIADHEPAASIYFKDPVNGLSLEFTYFTRELTEADVTAGHTFEIPSANAMLIDQLLG